MSSKGLNREILPGTHGDGNGVGTNDLHGLDRHGNSEIDS